MSLFFADTFYFLALIHRQDEAHFRALEITQRRPFRILTTDWILTELADALCDVSNRQLFARTYQSIRARPAATIVRVDSQIFDEAIALYLSRPDKDWSLTECTSFVVMRQYKITDCLTADHHFE